jgi:hypothetical protein
MEKIEKSLVEPYSLPDEQRKEMLEWYSNLAEMMRLEDVKDSFFQILVFFGERC